MEIKNVIWYLGIILVLVSAFATPYYFPCAIGIIVGLVLIMLRRIKRLWE